MNSVADFEDLLALFREHPVRYLIVGELAFILRAKPRYTKEMDLWVGGTAENIARANARWRRAATNSPRRRHQAGTCRLGKTVKSFRSTHARPAPRSLFGPTIRDIAQSTRLPVSAPTISPS
jgi:hypothetical protein